MIILGLAGGLGHDASANLVVDGRLVSLAEEERFIRSRHAHDHGVGDRISTLIAHARGPSIELKRQWSISESLRMFYLGLTNYLGFRFGQKGKVMGLASYGEPDESWMRFVLHDDGDYHTGLSPLCGDQPNFGPPLVHAWASHVEERFGRRPPRQCTCNSTTTRPEVSAETGKWQQHVAVSGQRVLDRALLHLVGNAVRETGCRNVVLVGGVGLNCTANGAGLVDRLAIFPASGDADTRAGAALVSAGERHGRALGTAGLGPQFSDDEIHTVLRQKGVPYTDVDDIADGRAVGWFQSRAEFGPRALGQRSSSCRPQIPDDDAPAENLRLLERLSSWGHTENGLKTSLNPANEPIVHSPQAALRSFFGFGSDGSMPVQKPAE